MLAQVDDEVVRAALVHLDGLAASVAQLRVNVEVDLCVVRSHEYYTGIAFEVDIITAVPATGWAFGVERLVHVLGQLGLLDQERSATTTVSLGQASADLLVVPGSDTTGYVNASRVAARHRDGGRCVDVYVGDPVGWRRYASARGIAQHEILAPDED